MNWFDKYLTHRLSCEVQPSVLELQDEPQIPPQLQLFTLDMCCFFENSTNILGVRLNFIFIWRFVFLAQCFWPSYRLPTHRLFHSVSPSRIHSRIFETAIDYYSYIYFVSELQKSSWLSFSLFSSRNFRFSSAFSAFRPVSRMNSRHKRKLMNNKTRKLFIGVRSHSLCCIAYWQTSIKATFEHAADKLNQGVNGLSQC